MSTPRGNREQLQAFVPGRREGCWRSPLLYGTFGRDFPDLLCIIHRPVVNGVGDPALLQRVVLGSRCCAENGDVFYCLAQLDGSSSHAT